MRIGSAVRRPTDMTECEMKLVKTVKTFEADETGAVTVDWVVLTAAVCSLVAVAMAGLKGNMTSIGQKVEDHLSSASINTSL